MGCIQSKDNDDGQRIVVSSPTRSSGTTRNNHNTLQQTEIKGIGRTERMIRREQKKGKVASRPSDHSGMSRATTTATTTSESKSKGPSIKDQLKISIRDRNNGSLKGPELDPITGNLVPSEVTRRRKRAIKVNSTTILNGTVTIEYAYCTQRGYYPDDPHKPNQDAYSIIHNFCSIPEDSFFAVYDGHGPVGEYFAKYAKENLPKLISKHFKQEQVQAHRARNSTLAQSEKIPFNPKLFPKLECAQYEKACKRAHIECNQNMIDTQPLVNLSGTTVIGAGFHNGYVLISNLGDSRAILGYRNEVNGDIVNNNNNEQKKASSSSSSSSHPPGKIVAVPLSQDQTPWRKDERQRIIKAGGRVLTIDQMEGKTSIVENEEYEQDLKLGESGFIDEKGDPPRVWLADKNIPGTSFTRSLGDSIADTVGVFAEPEFFCKPITDQDEILVLASDGVFEFLQNQDIIDICAQHSHDPTEACEQVVDAAYKKWLDYENRTDDITVVILFFRRHHRQEETNNRHEESNIVDTITHDQEEEEEQEDDPIDDTKSIGTDRELLGNSKSWSLKNALLSIML